MEVCCEPAVFVKAKLVVDASHATLHLTRIDQLLNNYYPIVLFYKGSPDSDVEQSLVKEDEKSKDAECDDATPLQAVRRIDEDGGEEEQECMEVRIDEDGGPGVQLVGARVNRTLHSLGDLSDPNPALEPFFATVDKIVPSPLWL